MDLLSEIVARKRQRVEAAKRIVAPGEVLLLAQQARSRAQDHAFSDTIKSEHQINIIAEFKRQSPSKGAINSGADPVTMTQAYQTAGAAAVSILTEEDYFDGSLDDLRAARSAMRLPILRKDFIFDEYQVYETAATGADALLLIVAVLSDETLVRLRELTEDELGMDALVEVHTREELDRARNCGARLIGVNNRDLRTFKVSLATSEELARLAPADAILVSESGLNPEAVRKLRAIGYKGFLVGEALMTADDPGKALREFTQSRERAKSVTQMVRIKICGITNLTDARAAIEAGADLLGFNFFRPSPRFIEPHEAREIIARLRTEMARGPRPVTIVGVFVNEPSPESLVRIAEETGIDAAQLHGDESVEFCRRVKQLLPKLTVIKALRAGDGFEPDEAANYDVDAIMLDSFHSELRGGTGNVFDWTVGRRTREVAPLLFLAGGLSSDNVAKAIAEVRPDAVDACSSIESSPGLKDAELMKAFVSAVRSG
jgi:indole-3-glycerol phosphate synthase/phosphoribosylanthranilate isomerase